MCRLKKKYLVCRREKSLRYTALEAYLQTTDEKANELSNKIPTPDTPYQQTDTTDTPSE